LLDRDRFEGDLELPDLHRAAMRDALRADRNSTLEADDGSVFVQVFSPPGRCFVIGAVHIAQPLTQMLPLIDYRPIVIDPRESFCTEARFPGVELSTEWPDEALQRLKPDHRSAIVTLTHDPKIDDPALEVALKTDAFYIGSLGSRRTHAGRLSRLKERGFSESDVRGRIHGIVKMRQRDFLDARAQRSKTFCGSFNELLNFRIDALEEIFFWPTQAEPPRPIP